jgi:hypothetical protein
MARFDRFPRLVCHLVLSIAFILGSTFITPQPSLPLQV